MIPGALGTSDPETLGGIPVFAGTRVPVRMLLDYAEDGQTLDVFLEDFPSAGRRQGQELIDWLKRTILEQAA